MASALAFVLPRIRYGTAPGEFTLSNRVRMSFSALADPVPDDALDDAPLVIVVTKAVSCATATATR